MIGSRRVRANGKVTISKDCPRRSKDRIGVSYTLDSSSTLLGGTFQKKGHTYMSSAKVLLRMAYICSSCETALRLKVADKIPSHCPYCGVVFDNNTSHGRIVNDDEESVTVLKPPLSSNG